MVDGRWSMVDSRWSMVDDRWSMDGRFFLFSFFFFRPKIGCRNFWEMISEKISKTLERKLRFVLNDKNKKTVFLIYNLKISEKSRAR